VTYKIIVVGGGTAGVMISTYLKSFWQDSADITMVYDHKRPGIGVGESLTPVFDTYLKRVGVSTIDLIKNCHATIKLGLKFKNWSHEGSEWYHSFPLNNAFSHVPVTLYEYEAINAYDIATGQHDNGYTYGQFYFKNNLIPTTDNLAYRHALHIDATLVSKYIENVFKDRLTIIDGIVEQVEVSDTRDIKSITLQSGQKLTADIFIDASGYERVLFKHLKSEWVDWSDQLITDRTIPNPLFKDFDEIPPYTTAEATKNGWILDVPLSNRKGTGYVYSSKFTTDQEAKEEFNKWLLKTYNVELASDRVISFKNGFHKEQWIGNCIAMGLASGFCEPLEATSLHHLMIEIDQFTRVYRGKVLEFDRMHYNIFLETMYVNSFKYIRFFYNTGRRDSEFWRYLDDNKPDWLQAYEDKAKHSFFTMWDIPNNQFMFESSAFNCVAYGHGMYKDNKSLIDFLKAQAILEPTKEASQKIKQTKRELEVFAVDHKAWITSILNQ
jgi:tryptophan halogenase